MVSGIGVDLLYDAEFIGVTGEAKLHHRRPLNARRLAFTFHGSLDDADDAVDINDVELQAATAGLLDAFGTPAFDQAEKPVHLAHSSPGKRAIQKAVGVDADVFAVTGGDSPQVVDVAHGIGGLLLR